GGQCSLNHDVSSMLSVIQRRYGSAFSYQRRLPADLDVVSLSPLRPFRLLHMCRIRISVVGRRPHNTVRLEAPWRVLAPNRFACFPQPDFSLGLRLFGVCALPSVFECTLYVFELTAATVICNEVAERWAVQHQNGGEPVDVSELFNLNGI